ncbi:MAG: hypothetical protein KJO36_13055 [Acidimicrobiia bacterium]|nr:hypothetical protein [Acidimicrobiia bacterium]MBT8251192.1 hypothetical protein [Acidimicrobiia bacterium]NNC44011.1 hypothetical protein [Acidimicrobiia bacterium]NNL29355.1 hypothetical protein [Acidimicrobiia bacterium]
MTACNITDDGRIEFALGTSTELDEHIETCSECQDYLAQLWSDELDVDLSVQIVQALRLQQFLESVIGLAADIAEDLGKAALRYGAGNDSSG